MPSAEKVFIVVQTRKVILGPAVTAQRRAVRQLLKVVQAAGDTLVAVGIEGIEVDARPADDAGIELTRIDDRVAVRVHHARLRHAVGVEKEAVFVGRIARAIQVSISQRRLDGGERGNALAIALELARAFLVSRLDRSADLRDGDFVALGDDQADAVFRRTAAQRSLRLTDGEIRENGVSSGNNLGRCS